MSSPYELVHLRTSCGESEGRFSIELMILLILVLRMEYLFVLLPTREAGAINTHAYYDPDDEIPEIEYQNFYEVVDVKEVSLVDRPEKQTTEVNDAFQ